MAFQRPGLPSDLPDPELLWARTGAYAAVCAGLGRADCVAEDAVVRRGEGADGDGFRLARVAGGRFLLVGAHRLRSPERGWPRPVDPFEGAPDWLPWEWLEQVPCPDFAYWWDGAWARTAYPDDWDDDGLGSAVEGTDADLPVWRMEILDPDTDGFGRGPLREALGTLVARAEEHAVDAASLGAVIGYLEHAGEADTERALECARGLGLTGDSEPLALLAGQGGPASGGCPVIGLGERLLLVGDAMRSAGEFTRPEAVTVLRVPRPPGADAGPPRPAEGAEPGEAALLPEVAALAAQMGGRVTGGRGDVCVLVFRAPHPRGLTSENGAEVPSDTGLPELLERLREQEAHPERGRWLFARITASPREVLLERVFDHWPTWENGKPDGTPEDLGFLASEMAARSAEWRPAWAALLDEASAFDPPWPGPPGMPSIPPLRPDAAGRVALLDRIGSLLRAAAGRRDWEQLHLSYRALVGYAGGTLVATGPAGDEELGLDGGLRAALAALRSVTYSEGRGAWFRAELVLNRAGGWRIVYDRDGEPDFAVPPPAFSYALDIRYYPRDAGRVPPWLAERLRSARG
ncbi:hypothetical protein ACFWTE_22325 [Nocardiopsis sp. NPDC058631]|uniref:hypothetical protein n=1 Tax=Nocardiopsis sp. NPDC058631 TaxID=3346566 RepID=UPI0036637886